MKNNSLKFNVFDTAIIIFSLATIICAYFNVNDKVIKLLPYKNQNAIITVVTQENIYSTLSINDKVKFYNNDEQFGTILTFMRRKQPEYITNDQGVKIKQPSADKFEYVLRIKTTIKSNDEGCFLNNTTFCSVGSQFELISDDVYFDAIVENIKIQ